MKNSKLFLTILLSVMLVFTIATTVFAADEDNDDFWSEPSILNEDGNENIDNGFIIDNGTNENIELGNGLDDNSTNENTFENITPYFNENDFEDNTENNEENDEEINTSTSNANSLADTGIGNFNGVVALIVIVSIIVAIYSVRKLNDYKNL